MSTDKQVIYTAQQLVDNLLAEKGAFFIHEEGSPYLGLSLSLQKTLAKMRRGDGRTPSWRLKQMRVATKQDYEKLLLFCNHALIAAWYDSSIRMDRIDVFLEVPYNFRNYWNKTLPRAVIVGYKDWTIVVQYKVDKIIDWLHSIGKSHYTASELRKSIWAICQEQEKLDLYYEYASVGSILELYGCIVNDNKDKKKVLRKNKGRKIVDKPVAI